MAEDRFLPASGVSVMMQAPPTGIPTTSRFRKGSLFMITRALLPLIVVGLLAGLLLGGTGGILVVVGIVIVVGIFWLSVQHRKNISRRLYTESPDDWMSRTAFYEGPFDGAGLPGAAAFERQHSLSGNPPQIRLVVTSDGLEFGPAGHSGTPMTVPYTELQSVQLVPGTRRRMVVVTPPIAHRLGRVVLTTAKGRVARFSGIPVEGLRAALVRKGARPTSQTG